MGPDFHADAASFQWFSVVFIGFRWFSKEVGTETDLSHLLYSLPTFIFRMRTRETGQAAFQRPLQLFHRHMSPFEAALETCCGPSSSRRGGDAPGQGAAVVAVGAAHRQQRLRVAHVLLVHLVIHEGGPDRGGHPRAAQGAADLG